jgi:hypothetical protein
MSRSKIIVMMSGYPDQELKDEADSKYAGTYMPRMRESVDHVDLRQLELDAKTLGMLDVPISKNHTVAEGRVVFPRLMSGEKLLRGRKACSWKSTQKIV